MTVRRLFVTLISVSFLGGITSPRLADAQTPSTDEETSSRPRLGAEEPLAPPPPDPLVWFNEPVFELNLKLDEYALRPVATAYDAVMPDAAQRGVQRFFKNCGGLRSFPSEIPSPWCA